MKRIVLDTNCLLMCIPKNSPYRIVWDANPHYRFGLIQSDADDNKFVDCVIAANAEYLVSNDSHFKVLEQISFPKVNLLHLKSFCRMLKGYHWNEDATFLNELEVEYHSKNEQ